MKNEQKKDLQKKEAPKNNLGDTGTPGVDSAPTADPISSEEKEKVADEKTQSVDPQERQSTDINNPDTTMVSGFGGVDTAALPLIADEQHDELLDQKINDVQSSDPKAEPTVLSYSQDPGEVNTVVTEEVSTKKTAKGIILEAEQAFADKFVNRTALPDFKASAYKSPVELWEAAFPGKQVPVVVAMVEGDGKYKEYRKDDLDYLKEGLLHYRPHSDLQRLFFQKFHEEQDIALLDQILKIGGKPF